MPTHEVARHDWPGFFDELSRKRKGHQVTVTIADPSSGQQSEVRSLPLVGISVDPRGSETGSIVIMAGSEEDDHVTHLIERPKHVYHKTGAGIISSELNADEIVEVTAADGPPITAIHIQSESVSL